MKEKKRMFLTICLLLMAGFAFAQTRTATGTVTSEDDGQALMGATVSVKGTQIGTMTDAQGQFSLSVPASATTLLVEFMGMESQEVTIQRTPMKIVMVTSSIGLDEVIHVAYGSQKKSSFTGAAATVDGDAIEKMQVSSISKALEGSTAGVQTVSSSGTPGSDAAIIIRGIGSISASQSPLIVMDGVPYEGSLNSIPAQDIESLTILKDAAANSMYGARGSNGVIVITTKQAVPGEVKVSFDARAGINTRGVPAYNNITNPDDYYEMMFESIANSLYEAGEYSYLGARNYVAENLIDDYLKYNIYKGVANDNIIDPLTGQTTAAVAGAAKKWNDDWQKDPFRNGMRQEYNVNVSGGTDKTKAYGSLSYLSDEGYLINSGFTRISARAKVDQEIGKIIKAGVNLAYSNTQQSFFNTEEENNYSNLFMFSQQIGPIYPIYLYDMEGNKQKDLSGNFLYDYGTEYTRPYAMEQNPYAILMGNENTVISDNLSSRAYVDVNILKDLKFSVNMAYDVFNGNEAYFDTPDGGDAKEVGGRGYKYGTRYSAMNANQLLNWTPKFGDHSINLLLGHETKSDASQLLYGHMTGFVDANNHEFANAVLYQDLTSYTSSYSLEGLFSRLEYDYADKYYFQASFRRDASSRFHPDVRWGTFWSLSGSWRVSEEAFLAGNETLTNLKLKASYGTQGNDNVGRATVYTDLYQISRVNGEAGVTKIFRGNPQLTWEKSNNFNAGFEMGLFDRVNVNADFFVKETKDMLYARPLPPSEGSPSTRLVNDIDMKNTGIEVDINATLIKTRNLNWKVNFNLTHYKNEMTKLPSDKDPNGYQRGNYWMKKGGSLYDWYTYEYAGVDKTNGLPLYNKYTETLDEEGKGTGEYTISTVNKTSEATLRETGKSAIPDLYGGLSTTLDAYGFDLSISTAFQLGGYVMDDFYRIMMNPGEAGTNMHTDMFRRWTPTNTDTDVPRLCYQNQDVNGICDRWLTSASYFSLRNVALGYTLPSKLTKKWDVQKARVYVSGDNLWLKSARKGLDPRQSFSGTTGYNYSALATYSVGLNLVF